MSSIEACENDSRTDFGNQSFADDAFLWANPIFFLDLLGTLAAQTGQAAGRRERLRSRLIPRRASMESRIVFPAVGPRGANAWHRRRSRPSPFPITSFPSIAKSWMPG